MKDSTINNINTVFCDNYRATIKSPKIKPKKPPPTQIKPDENASPTGYVAIFFFETIYLENKILNIIFLLK